ncbi:hypothetical protein JJB09_02980 [Rhizobium sp. KVB221]|uniref:Peptide O-xylosyltransferase n=1 Tax=Rhizobium setariae TaxID=2801340 RepID=A0A936YLL3_9HYPH|nr:beta-1,6-N-acetylglucosaminyltransferase [Rhizobium setariae]MBL0370982.1 hypothetical protein [Rhizobium setariae]
MAKITFIILAHENAELVSDLARLLTGFDAHAHAVIHYDLKSPAAEFSKLKEQFAGSNRVHLVRERIKCGWGDFSLVEATLRALRLIRDKQIDSDRVMLVSGVCMPIRPLAELSAFLDSHPDREFIEAYDSSWVSGGMREDRYRYHHICNQRNHPALFKSLYVTQKTLRLKRKLPPGLVPRFGSQWWTLTWSLCARMLDFLDRNPGIYKFFKTTWIADELVFQTLVYHFVPPGNVTGHSLTFYQFNEGGLPLVFSDRHMPLLDSIPRFFARKIDPNAKTLRVELSRRALQTSNPASPLLEPPVKWRLPRREIAARKSVLEPGYSRLFANNGKEDLPESLLEYDRSFVVLYGPPSVTEAVTDQIRGLAGYTVLGRIFQPGVVNFGNNIKDFHGLRPCEAAIRDSYPANYLRRIFLRCAGIPVFAMSPGDHPEIEAHFLRSPKAAVFAVAPRFPDTTWRDLYWLLCGSKTPERAPDDRQSLNTDFDQLDGPIDTDVEIRNMLDTILQSERTPIRRADLEADLAGSHGNSAAAILTLYDIASAAMPAELGDAPGALPIEWRSNLNLPENGSTPWKIIPDLKLRPRQPESSGIRHE